MKIKMRYLTQQNFQIYLEISVTSFNREDFKQIVYKFTSTTSCVGYNSLQSNWDFQLVENSRVYLQAKNQLHPPYFSGDMAKRCRVLILGALGMPGYIHPKW